MTGAGDMQDIFECGHPAPCRYLRGRGFSLVELLVVSVLVASSALVASPLLSKWHARDRVDGAARALLASLTLARGEAIARGTRVVVCPAHAGAHCLPKGQVCAHGGAGWSCGWMVIVDPPRAGQPLRAYRRTSGVSIDATATAVEFTPPAGLVIGGFRKFELAAAGVAAGEQSDTLRRCIRIAAGGRARLEPGGCGGRARA
jgi:type IV fimbrial biogenesis protein FimT